MPNKKAITCYSRPVINVYLWHWFPITYEETHVNSPKPQPIQEKGKKIVGEWSKKTSPKVVTKEQFINERQLMLSTNISPRPIH
jgi:hypothetical protein